MASSRCFVIGNGPSLTPEQLEAVKDEHTYATGRINLMYPHTTWRPTYYVLSEKLYQIDETQAQHDFREIINKNGTMSYVQAGLMALVNGPSNVNPFETCLHALDDDPPESWHLPELCSYGSSVHVAMQIAANMLYQEIYLLGCDLVGGHFDENYGESKVQTDLWRKAHEIAARTSPIPIFNATIGGTLECYPRVSL